MEYKDKKIVCYFGDFDPEYSRNRVIMKGLRENGFQVISCNVRSNGFKKYKELRRCLKGLEGRFDVLVVGHTDNRWMTPWAKLLTRKSVFWDGFYSLYDSWVNDRKLVSRLHPKAWYYWAMDTLNVWLAEVILVDTHEHAKYFHRRFRAPKEKLARVFVGSDIEGGSDGQSTGDEETIVHFHGNYIPLQGVTTIVEAAALLREEKIVFQLVGSGQDSRAVRELAVSHSVTNITFVERVPYEQLVSLIRKSDICLGIFGDTGKASRVIPNKVYEGIAVEKPVITSDSPAIRELFSDRENILLCERANPEDLADKIRELIRDDILREKIAKHGYLLYKKELTPVHVVVPLVERLSAL